MTAQIGEVLIYEGQENAMCTEPLEDFFEFGGSKPAFEPSCSALWRGYVGTWEIVNNRLYMVGLDGTLTDGTNATLETVFSGYPNRVFAHWYSGTLRIPEGKMLKYLHMGYGSTYERDRFFTIEKGVVIDIQVCQNGVAEEDEALEGYSIKAMTILPKHNREEGNTR
jgi:hypothetical protein